MQAYAMSDGDHVLGDGIGVGVCAAREETGFREGSRSLSGCTISTGFSREPIPATPDIIADKEFDDCPDNSDNSGDRKGLKLSPVTSMSFRMPSSSTSVSMQAAVGANW